MSDAPRLGRMRRRLAAPDGFTLIEVLIATLILTVGILGGTKLIVSSESSTVDIELQQVANEQGERALESVRALSYDEIGYGSSGAPAGSTFEAPDAPGAEDLVMLSGGAGVTPEQTFSVDAGTGGPPITGTVRTYVTWRDEECTLLDLSDLPGVATLRSRITALQAQLSTLTGSTGLVTSTLSQLTTALISLLPPSNRGQVLKDELNAISPLLNTAVTQAALAQDVLDQLDGLVDVCDIDAADLADVKTLLEQSSTDMATLAQQLVSVNSTLSDLKAPLNTLFNNLIIGICGILPPICGDVTSNLSASYNVLKPNKGDPPKTVAARVNPVLTTIAGLDFSGLGLDTTHNTKRVSVEVTIDPVRDDITPQNPVWLSSVVTEPEAGLIIDGGL